MRKYLFQFGPCFYVLIVITNIILMIIPNSDLTLGRWVLDLDEQILFDQLIRIFHYDSKEQFLKFIYSSKEHGGWPHYGAIFFNLNALICFIPKIFFGDPGVIFFGRMSGVLFLTSSFIFFTITFLRGWYLRSFCMLTLLNIPEVSYFMCNPKPEQIQLFFLSLFFFFYKKYDFSLGKRYWISLGISFGTKISVLPFIFLVPIFAIAYNINRQSFKHSAKQLPKTLFFICLGLVISEPYLFPNLFFSSLFFVITKQIFLRIWYKISYSEILIVFAILIFNVFYSVILEKIYFVETGVSNWLNIFLDTGNLNDKDYINIISWINYIFTEWLSKSFFTNLFFLSTSSIIFLSTIINFSKNNIFEKKYFNIITLTISSFAVMIILFIKVKRLWGW